jgi:predicted AlkP superfamily pyrophosphatase or phosphodiesterase
MKTARRVVIVSIDGLRPDAIALAHMPNLSTLMQSSAFSLGAHTVFPGVTLVAHTSMLSGLCPSKHGVDWNDLTLPSPMEWDMPTVGFLRNS